MMTATLTLVAVICITSNVLAAPLEEPGNGLNTLIRPRKKVETVFCRLFDGMSRCVGEPLPVSDEEPWCPYRMCAPSYVPADKCPVNPDVQATDKCLVKTITRDVYKCDGKDYASTYVPIGCNKDDEDCKEVTTCSCYKVEYYTSTVLTQLIPFRPYCKP